MSLLPSRGPDTSTSQDGQLQVVGVDEDVAPLLDALGSETARQVLNEIYEDPGTPSEIADRVDASIQTVSYHLEKLEEQDLIAVAGTRYSEKGQEMTVYEPPEEPLVVFVGTEERKDSLKTMLKRLLPVVGALGVGSLLVDQLYGPGGLLPAMGSAGGGGGGDDFDAASADGGDADVAANATATETPPEPSTEAPAEAATETPAPTEAPEPTPMTTGEPASTPTPEETGISIAQETETATEAPETARVATETAADTTALDAPTTTPTPAPTTEAVEPAREAATTAAGISPGLAFFLGGMLVVAVLVGWWALREYGT